MCEFYFVKNSNTDPCFNLALEEYLLKYKKDYFISVWRNTPSVIVGVNQNTVSEVNLAYTEQNGIKVVRRITGGGAVYHDLNNVNYTFIAPSKENQIPFKIWSKPVIEYLKTLGINAEFSGRNDLLIENKKISGTAETVYKDRVLHHGTLLFDTDSNKLAFSLKENQLKTIDKGIKSVKSRVANIKDYLKSKISINEFIKGLSLYLQDKYSEYVLTDQDLIEINKLALNKYSSHEWNVGRAPKASNNFTKKFKFGIFNFNFDIINGKIENAKITGDFFPIKSILVLEEGLNGIKFSREDLKKAFLNVGEFILNAEGEEIVNSILK